MRPWVHVLLADLLYEWALFIPDRQAWWIAFAYLVCVLFHAAINSTYERISHGLVW